MHIVQYALFLLNYLFFKHKTQEPYLKKTSYITHIVKQFSLDALFQSFLAFIELSRNLSTVLTTFALYISV